MKKGIKYFRDGLEIDEQDALENGVLRDGVSMSVPTTMRDSLSALQRAVAASRARIFTVSISECLACLSIQRKKDRPAPTARGARFVSVFPIMPAGCPQNWPLRMGVTR